MILIYSKNIRKECEKFEKIRKHSHKSRNSPIYHISSTLKDMVCCNKNINISEYYSNEMQKNRKLFEKIREILFLLTVSIHI